MGKRSAGGADPGAVFSASENVAGADLRVVFPAPGNVAEAQLLFKGLDPKVLDYDDYWNPDVSASIEDFERLTKDDYRDILYKNGFIRDSLQRRLF